MVTICFKQSRNGLTKTQWLGHHTRKDKPQKIDDRPDGSLSKEKLLKEGEKEVVPRMYVLSGN